MTIALILALILDAVLGEPGWLWSRFPHPVVLMGRLVSALDARLNTGPPGRARQIRGLLALAALSAVVLLIGALISHLPGGFIWSVLIAAVLLATRSLADHVRAVADALRLSEADGRVAVSQIVGRDTAGMDAPAIARSAIESAAENFSDGVVAPAFWFLIGGLPGLLVYKMVNTADSMIGYRNARYEDFGKAAARLDDILNWVPARLTGLMIAAVHGVLGQRAAIARDARLHRSPNAGWPEASMAVALDVALAGPRSYDGKLRDFPFVNPVGRRDPGAGDIEGAVAAIWRSWWMGIAVLGLLWVLLL